MILEAGKRFVSEFFAFFESFGSKGVKVHRQRR